jgi:hypothetical protein
MGIAADYRVVLQEDRNAFIDSLLNDIVPRSSILTHDFFVIEVINRD